MCCPLSVKWKFSLNFAVKLDWYNGIQTTNKKIFGAIFNIVLFLSDTSNYESESKDFSKNHKFGQAIKLCRMGKYFLF